MIFAFVGVQELIPLLVFAGIVAGILAVLSMISNRNSRAQERLERISRPASLAEIEDPKLQEGALPGRHGDGQGAVRPADAADRAGAVAAEDQAGQRRLPQRLGRRRSTLGMRFAVPDAVFLLLGVAIFLPKYGLTLAGAASRS